MSIYPSRILRLPEVMARVGLKRESVYRLVRSRALAKPLKLGAGGRASGWKESDVEEFIATCVAARDGGAK